MRIGAVIVYICHTAMIIIIVVAVIIICYTDTVINFFIAMDIVIVFIIDLVSGNNWRY